jgi:hypothetical protein
MGIFIDGSILQYRFASLLDFYDLAEAAVEKIHLQVERPPGHIVIEITEVTGWSLPPRNGPPTGNAFPEHHRDSFSLNQCYLQQQCASFPDADQL